MDALIFFYLDLYPWDSVISIFNHFGKGFDTEVVFDLEGQKQVYYRGTVIQPSLRIFIFERVYTVFR